MLMARPVCPQLRKCRVDPGSYAWCQFRTSRSQFSSFRGAAIRVPASGADAFRDQKPPSIVACPQIERHELTSVPERFPKIPSVSRDRGQRHHTPPCPDAGRIDAGAGRRGVKRCPSSRRLAAHHQHIGCQIERFISIAVARHLSGGGHTPVRTCSGSAVQAGSSKRLFDQAGRNARAASILRIQCGTAVSGCLGKADTRG